MKIEALRCSSLPIAFLCPGSVRAADVLIDPHHDEAALGTSAHEAMRSVVAGRDVDVDALATAHQVSAKDLGLLVWYGRKAWESMRAEFAGPCEPVTELELHHNVRLDAVVMLTGHIDIAQSLDVGVVAAADWKSGRKDADYYHQAAGYAALLMIDDIDIREVRFSVVWLREQEVQRWTFTRERINEWVLELGEKVINWDGVYHPGVHCSGCRRNHACPAVTAMVRRDVEFFAVTGNGYNSICLATADGEQLADLDRRQKTVAAFAKSLHEAIKAEVKARGGSVDCGNGGKLELVEENAGREIDTIKAWPVLSSQFSATEMAGFVSISATSLDEATVKQVPKGQGAKARRELRAKLDEAGAVTQRTVTKLKERKG